MGRISDLLEQVQTGKMETGDAADRLRKMKLARREPQAAGILALGSDDPRGHAVEDDGHEIAQAFADGKITKQQYAVLAGAAAESSGKR